MVFTNFYSNLNEAKLHLQRTEIALRVSNFLKISKSSRKTGFSTIDISEGLILKHTSHVDTSMTGKWFLFSYDCNRIPTSQENPGASCLSPVTSRVNQRVIQKNLLPSVDFLIFSRGTTTKGQTCLRKGLTCFESGVV